MLMTEGVVGCVRGYCSWGESGTRVKRTVGVGEGGWTVDAVSKRSVCTRHSSVWWSSSPQVEQR